jgi:hypothetical protein
VDGGVVLEAVGGLGVHIILKATSNCSEDGSRT